MSHVFRRTSLAAQMATRLLRPSVLDEGLRSGLFLAGVRRIGKTTFLLNDLIPALESNGALVIYVDLWSDSQANPAGLVHSAIRACLEDMQTPSSAVLERLRRLSGGDIGVGPLKFGFKLDSVGAKEGITLARALTALVDQAKRDVVLIVDEVQHAITSDEGQQMLLALKAARDAINHRPRTPGHFLFIGTGSHRALVNELTTRRNQAFAGAVSVPYPVLGDDYVAHLLERLAAEGFTCAPSLEVAAQAFLTLGSRPEEMIRALQTLQSHLPVGASPDEHLPVIAATLRSAAADIELAKVDQMGPLAKAIFERVVSADGDVRGLYSADVVADYGRTLGRPVRVEEAQPVVKELVEANLLMRTGHGAYRVADPFVQAIWRERRTLSERGVVPVATPQPSRPRTRP